MMKSTLFALILGLVACGGGGKKKEETKPDPNPTPTETMAKTDPTPPAETKPEEKPPEPPKPDPEAEKKAAMDAEIAAFEKAKPVFEANCKGCHFKGQKNASAKKLAEFDITTYPFGGKHGNAADIKKSLGIGGGKATMPKNKPGSVKGDELALIAAWADAFDASHEGGAHEDHQGHGGHHH